MAEKREASPSNDKWTCGKGLAAHARIPAKIAEFLKSLAQNLEAHVPAIDTSDANGTAERAAYDRLWKAYDGLATQLASTAQFMAACEDLPAAHHHEETLADPRLMEAFAQFVALQTELAEMLRASADQDRQLLQPSTPANE